MEYIAPTGRTEFVLKHHTGLTHAGAPSPDELRQLMESIVRKEYFGLPLNLLFLSTVTHPSRFW